MRRDCWVHASSGAPGGGGVNKQRGDGECGVVYVSVFGGIVWFRECGLGRDILQCSSHNLLDLQLSNY
jgi:hypothetical protein